VFRGSVVAFADYSLAWRCECAATTTTIGPDEQLDATLCRRLGTHSAKAILRVQQGEFSVNDEQVLGIVHQRAAEMMAARDGEVIERGSAVSTEGPDSLMDRYGFSSIDALEFLLVLEKEFGITLADENLNGEVLSSASALAKHIAALRQT
jgi:acyl carrier protein